MWSYNYSTPYLAHHGILGMKWGVRRFQNADGSLTVAGKRRYKADESYTLDTKTNDSAPKSKKRALKIGVAVAAGFVAAYGAYRLYDSGELNRLSQKGRAIFTKAADYGLKRNPDLSKSMTVDEITKTFLNRINPDYGRIGTLANCRRCTFAYELCRRGYDVRATKSISGTGGTFQGVRRMTNQPAASVGRVLRELYDVASQGLSEGDIISKALSALGNGRSVHFRNGENRTKRIFTELERFPNGSRGEIATFFNKGSRHSMAFEIVNNQPVVFDFQTHDVYKNWEKLESLFEHNSGVKSTNLLRLDNVDLNIDLLRRWVVNN